MKTYTVRTNANGTFAITDQNGIVYNSGLSDLDGFLYAESAQDYADSLNHTGKYAPQPETPEQTKWFAIHGVPSTRSLKNLDAKLARIARDEEIENGSEEM